MSASLKCCRDTMWFWFFLGVEVITPSSQGQSVFSPAMLRKDWFPRSSKSRIAPAGAGAGNTDWSGLNSGWACASAHATIHRFIIPPSSFGLSGSTPVRSYFCSTLPSSRAIARPMASPTSMYTSALPP